MGNKKSRLAIDAIYNAAKLQLSRIEGIEAVSARVPVCSDLINIVAPDFLGEDETVTLCYYSDLLVEIDTADSYYLIESIKKLPRNVQLAVATSIPDLLACAIEEARESRDKLDAIAANYPFPRFANNGYYLEDAIWPPESLSDINPPDEDIRDDLEIGQRVKLVFRFAAEDADRQDNECERIWVEVTAKHADGRYEGTIEDVPHHDAAKCGDSLVFHPHHVAEIGEVE